MVEAWLEMNPHLCSWSKHCTGPLHLGGAAQVKNESVILSQESVGLKAKFGLTACFLNLFIFNWRIIALQQSADWGFPSGSGVKSLLVNAGSVGSIPGSGRSPGGGHGNSLQDSCLENPTDRGAWRATVHRVAKSWTQLKRLSTHAHIALVPAIHQHGSAIGIHRPPPSGTSLAPASPSHASRLPQSPGFQLPVSRGTHCVYFNTTPSIHPTLSFPHCAHNLFPMSVSLLLPCDI